MKALITFLLITSALSFSAHGKTRIIEEAPSIQFYFNKVINFVPLTEVCLNGDWLETVNEKKVCVEYEEVRRNHNRRRGPKYKCKSYDKRTLATAVEYTRRKCVRYNRHSDDKKCREWQTVTMKHPTTFTKTIRRQRYNQNRRRWNKPGYAMSKEIVTVPQCL